MKSVSKSEITGGQLLGLGFVCIAGLVLILVGVSLGNLLGAVIGGLGILAIILSVGLILLGTVRALKSVKKLYLFIVLGVLVIASMVAYPLYAKESCSQSAIRHSAYSRNGELYSELTRSNGEHAAFLTRDNYIKFCMQDQFKLSF